MRRSPRDAPDPVLDAPAVRPSERRVAAAVLLFALWIAYGVAESFLWRDRLWGAHALGFLPPGWTLAALVPALLLLPGVAGALEARPARVTAGRGTRRWLPVAAGAAAALLFWLARERHLFWGDALPLSITVP